MTRTVKLNVPAVPGVPEIIPLVGSMVNGGGNVPALIDQVSVPVPPLPGLTGCRPYLPFRLGAKTS